jgi:hypothetical protein
MPYFFPNKEGKYCTQEEVWGDIDRERAEKQKEKECTL